MTFYLKYRPKNLDELDLKDVGETLKKIVKSGNIPHAFLFAGPKGTGKTSAARILAKIVNCIGKNPPCDTCDQCLSITKGNNLDVIEMDAASNRGIDDIRSLRDAIKLAPTSAKKKIYIVDEAHMLTSEASNALLKTLEEPPEHVIFILATTNPEKLIDTIRSRAVSVNFRKATQEEIISSLKRVIDGEKLNISEATLKNIAKKAGGAFRDGVKILEQVSIEGEEFVNKFLEGEDNFIQDLYKKDRQSCLNFIRDNIEKGLNIESLLKNIMQTVQNDIVEGKTELVKLAELLIEANAQMKNSPIEELPLEIAVVKWCGEMESGMQNLEFGEDKTELNDNIDAIPNASFPVQASNWDNEEVWKKILSTVRPVNASLEALLRSSKPLNYDGTTLTLGVFYKFHKERLEESNHRKIVEEIVTKVLNNETRIVCTLTEAPIIAPLTEGKDQDIIKVAEEIFS